MTKFVTVKSYSVGTNFGVEASVKIGRKVIHTTDTYPIGCESSARDSACAWAEKHGYAVR